MKQIFKVVLFFFVCASAEAYQSSIASVSNSEQQYVPHPNFHCIYECMSGKHISSQCEEMCDV